MERRVFLRVLSLPAALGFVPPLMAFAQDREFERALERSQRERPATFDWTARIAPATEPGDALVIHGRVVASDGRTPVANAVVFAYHTDREGLYAPESAPPHTWRLRGWSRTTGDGRFEFHTIRPGSYPSRRQAAHVHFTVFANDGSYHGGALEFDDDPLIGSDDRQRANASGEFGTIRRVRREGGTQHVDYNIRLDPRQRF